MPSQKNINQIQNIKEKASKAKSIILFDYSGTNSKEQVELRSAIREAGGEMLVAKNTLMKLAMNQASLADSLSGMNALVFSYDDEVSALKKLFDFHKKTEKLTIKQGVLEDKVLSAAEIEALSQLPGKKELIVTLINRVKGPAYTLTNVLKASQRDLLFVLQAIAKKN